MELFLDENEVGLVSMFIPRLKSATAVRDYKREINKFKQFLDKSILNANDQDVENYLEFLRKEGKAKSTIQRTYHQLNAFYNFLFAERLVDTNPFFKVDVPKASKQVKVERTPNPEQLKKLLDAVRINFELRDYAIILLIATTGIKVTDALNITLVDLIYDEKFMALRIGQGENMRYIKILEPMKNVITEYLLSLYMPKEYMDKSYYIFMRTRDIDKFILAPEKVKPVTKDWIRKVMEAACSMADIPLFTSKDLRHAHVLYAARLGASVDNIANQLGWNDTNLIYKYHGIADHLIYSANSYTEVFFNQILND